MIGTAHRRVRLCIYLRQGWNTKWGSLANTVDFPPPQSATDDIRKVIAESAGWVGDVDNVFKTVTGWSPLERLIAPLSGNWNENSMIRKPATTRGPVAIHGLCRTDSEVPPELRGGYDKIMKAAAAVDDAAIKLDRVTDGDWDSRIDVTDHLLNFLTGGPKASAELRHYATRVAGGECRWEQIESQLRALPAELVELKDSPRFIWFSAPPIADVDEDYEPYRIPWERPN